MFSFISIFAMPNDWAIVNQIPVMINEFGVAKFDFTLPENIYAMSECFTYSTYHVSLAHELGIACGFWDDSGSFRTFDCSKNTLGPEKDI